MANCAVCQKQIAVALYIRAKPMFEVAPGRYRAAPAEKHLFLGYWPKESHLGEYIRMEYEREQQGAPDPILQRLWEANCRGHSVYEIIEVIEQRLPPLPGVAVKILWNPSPRVTEYLEAETARQREEAKLRVNNDLRWTMAFSKQEIKPKTLFLVNNSIDRVFQTISRPAAAVKGY